MFSQMFSYRRSLAVFWCISIGWLPTAVYGLNLGGLTVQSRHGEPLRLILSVEAVSPEESKSLNVTLASRSDYSQAGLEYPVLAEELQFELIPLDSGDYQVVITTEPNVEHANLALLLAATWTGGRLVREYAVILTPLESGNRITPPSASDNSTFSRPSTPVSPGEELIVKWGDTLSHIVQRMNLPDNLHQFQGYLAILQANPGAFIDNNMNRLRSGVKLQIPTLEAIALVSYSDSVRAYSEHLARFTAYRNSLRSHRVVEPKPEKEQFAPEPEFEAEDESEMEETDRQEESSLLTEVEQDPILESEPQGVDEPEVVAEESARGLLTISQGADVDNGPSEVDLDDTQTALTTFENQLSQLDESLLASETENEAVLESLNQLRTQSANISKLIEVEDAHLAAMQQRIEARQDGESDDNPETGSVDADQTLTQQEVLEVAEGDGQNGVTGTMSTQATNPDASELRGQAAVKHSGNAGQTNRAESSTGTEAELASPPVQKHTPPQIDSPSSSAMELSDQITSLPKERTKAEAGVETKEITLPESESGTDDVHLAQAEQPLSSIEVLQEESRGVGDPIESHRPPVTPGVLMTMKNFISTIFGQVVLAGLIILMLGLVVFRRVNKNRGANNSTLEPKSDTPAV